MDFVVEGGLLLLVAISDCHIGFLHEGDSALFCVHVFLEDDGGFRGKLMEFFFNLIDHIVSFLLGKLNACLSPGILLFRRQFFNNYALSNLELVYVVVFIRSFGMGML